MNTIVPTDPNVDIHRLGSREVSAWDKMHINIRYCPGKDFGSKVILPSYSDCKNVIAGGDTGTNVGQD